MPQVKKYFVGTVLLLFATTITYADKLTSQLYSIDGKSLGQVAFEDTKYGLLIKPQLSGLPAGIHGFHIHQHPDCGKHAKNAGEHFDPATINSHQGPYGNGHLGDLPILSVKRDGTADTPMLAPRLTTKDIKDHALIIHENGDNYSDKPPLGGGGARIACGKIPS